MKNLIKNLKNGLLLLITFPLKVILLPLAFVDIWFFISTMHTENKSIEMTIARQIGVSLLFVTINMLFVIGLPHLIWLVIGGTLIYELAIGACAIVAVGVFTVSTLNV